jgi:polyribonucleotide nucleotidyltransferase
MKKAIGKPRSKVSVYAPKIRVITVPTEKIGDIIGPGGRTIKEIIAETGAQVDVEDDGAVNISGMNDTEVEAALARVEALVKEVKQGEVYEGEVKRIQPFGAFVEVLPGKEGLVHVSDMSKDFVKDPSDLVSIGDKVSVKVKEIDDFGRINLTMLLDDKPDSTVDRKNRKRSGRRKFARGRRENSSKSSGPHFPTSRLLGKKKRFRR